MRPSTDNQPDRYREAAVFSCLKANEELNALIAGAQNLRDEYHRILSWADLYDKCSFDARKMIVFLFCNPHKKKSPQFIVTFLSNKLG